MSVPEGAYSVQYDVLASAEDVEISTKIEISFSSSASQLPHEDAAAQAAAEAYIAAITAAYPSVPVQAHRVYKCLDRGDAWPVSAAGGDETGV
ncbi:hypothetical protein [Streptomyces sp. NPDC050804]|uniref:hypothetical protein n=1 Tax=Streptomyces sp. NPDC050804 TaxID=3154745 RepID=UPI0034303809